MSEQHLTADDPFPLSTQRVPPQLDRLVDEIAAIERRKKNAIVTLALEEYTARHHPELLGPRKGVAR